jgi:hypothetical protein
MSKIIEYIEIYFNIWVLGRRREGRLASDEVCGLSWAMSREGFVTKRRSKCSVEQCFSTAGPRPGTGPWHQLYRAARICHFSFLSIFHEYIYFIVEIF